MSSSALRLSASFLPNQRGEEEEWGFRSTGEQYQRRALQGWCCPFACHNWWCLVTARAKHCLQLLSADCSVVQPNTLLVWVRRFSFLCSTTPTSLIGWCCFPSLWVERCSAFLLLRLPLSSAHWVTLHSLSVAWHALPLFRVDWVFFWSGAPITPAPFCAVMLSLPRLRGAAFPLPWVVLLPFLLCCVLHSLSLLVVLPSPLSTAV